MPQVRDPKTGRYTSGGGSSVGGAASTNPRIQKAAAVGNGATAGGATPNVGDKMGTKALNDAGYGTVVRTGNGMTWRKGQHELPWRNMDDYSHRASSHALANSKEYGGATLVSKGKT